MEIWEETIEVKEDYIYLGTTFNYNWKFDKPMAKQIIQVK